MDIGITKPAIWVEPLTQPKRIEREAPAPTPEKSPAPEREKVGV